MGASNAADDIHALTIRQQFDKDYAVLSERMRQSNNNPAIQNDFYDLLTRYAQCVIRLPKYNSFSEADKEDIVQNAVLALMNHFHTRDTNTIVEPRNYVSQTVFHAALAYARKRKKTPIAYGDYGNPKGEWVDNIRDYREYQAYKPTADEDTPFTPAERTMLEKAIASLDECHKGSANVLNSFYLCNPRKSMEQLSLEMDCPLGTAKSRLFVAKQRLHKEITAIQGNGTKDNEHSCVATTLLNKLAAFDIQHLPANTSFGMPCR